MQGCQLRVAPSPCPFVVSVPPPHDLPGIPHTVCTRVSSSIRNRRIPRYSRRLPRDVRVKFADPQGQDGRIRSRRLRWTRLPEHILRLRRELHRCPFRDAATRSGFPDVSLETSKPANAGRTANLVAPANLFPFAHGSFKKRRDLR